MSWEQEKYLKDTEYFANESSSGTLYYGKEEDDHGIVSPVIRWTGPRRDRQTKQKQKQKQCERA